MPHWALLEESIDRAFNETCDNILVAGDFNINIQNSTSNKITRLISSYNAEQLITTPTHYTEHSSSLIDLMFIKHTQHVLTSFVADPFIPDLVRFHCPTITVMKFDKPNVGYYKRRIWLYDKGDYGKYREILKNSNWDNVLRSQNPDTIVIKITDIIIDAASKSIPNKIATIRPNDIPWFNCRLRRLIRKRNIIHKKAKTNNNEITWAHFRKIRNEVTSLLRKCKLEYKDGLVEKINNDNISAKTWFKLAKQLTDKHSSSTQIPTLLDNRAEATTDIEKTEMLNAYFCRQSSIDDSGHGLPPLIMPQQTISSISISSEDIYDCISIIDPSKASGPDLISPRLLREGASELSLPLSAYFNLLLATSYFPPAWKLANVTPHI